MAGREAIPANWAELPDEQLLDLRMSDLPLSLAGTVMETRLAQLRTELLARGLDFPIHFYLASEWFTPDGHASMAVPFYLAHPRLEKLEQAQMLAVEGGEHEWCMRILRHEAGHVVDNAYKLRLRRQRRALFGKSSEAYPEFYAPKPYSKSFVLHLDPWYAQSHPDEDFAETFALWLTPQSNWQQRYAGWPAIKKLEYMDELMQSLAGKAPKVAIGRRSRTAPRPSRDPARLLSTQAAPLRSGSPGVLRSRSAAVVLRCAGAPRSADRGAFHPAPPARRAPARRRVDGNLSVHDRQGHRRHDCP